MPLDAVRTRPARPFLLVTAVATAAVALAACSSGGGNSTTTPTSPVNSTSPAAADARTANVTITSAEGCSSDHRSFAAGGITFKVTNKDATAVSEVEVLDGERIVGEKENMPPGLGGEFAVQLDAGTYTLYCPGANPERQTFTVTGTAAASNSSVSGLLTAAARQYKTYVDTQVTYMLSTARQLDAALHGTNLLAAQKIYETSRGFYEKIEPVAESFVTPTQNLDSDIDARIDMVTSPAKWYGYHRIEKGLFADKSLAGLGAYGDKLVRDITTLKAKTAALTYAAPDLANGAQGLLDEVASTKITGEEEAYSHIDLLDMSNNVEGAQQAFADLQPALKTIDASLSSTIQSQFTALDTLLQKYRTTDNPSGYVLYTTLTSTDKRELAAAVKAVQQPLSTVASKVANA